MAALFPFLDMNMQWNIDLTAPPLKCNSRQHKRKQECHPGHFENDLFAHELEATSVDEEFGCSRSGNKIANQVTFIPESQNTKFQKMELAAMVQSFANDEALFFDEFGRALGKLGSVGYAIEGQIAEKESKFTRLGILKVVDLSTCEL